MENANIFRESGPDKSKRILLQALFSAILAVLLLLFQRWGSA